MRFVIERIVDPPVNPVARLLPYAVGDPVGRYAPC
jgi:hypothetical protein